MKLFQFSRGQATAILDSGIWEHWSKETIVKMQLFQNEDLLPFVIFKEALYNFFGKEFSDVEIMDRDWRIRREWIYEVGREIPTKQFYWQNIPQNLFNAVA